MASDGTFFGDIGSVTISGSGEVSGLFAVGGGEVGGCAGVPNGFAVADDGFTSRVIQACSSAEIAAPLRVDVAASLLAVRAEFAGFVIWLASRDTLRSTGAVFSLVGDRSAGAGVTVAGGFAGVGVGLEGC
jgi:hypothetical protein